MVVESPLGPFLVLATHVKAYINQSPLIRFTADALQNVTPVSVNTWVRDLAALTADRGTNLVTTTSQTGFSVTISRNGSSGGHNRKVFQNDGTTLIKAIPDNFYATFVYDALTSSPAWYLAAYGQCS